VRIFALKARATFTVFRCISSDGDAFDTFDIWRLALLLEQLTPIAVLGKWKRGSDSEINHSSQHAFHI
jgi:hypothetical protein